MHPVLFHVGNLAARSYGVFLALAFVIGIYIAQSRAPRHGIEPQRMFDVFFVIVVAALVGSRLLYVLEHVSQYAAEPSRLFQLRQGGLSMYGGVLLAAAGAAFYCKRMSIPFLNLADTCAPSLALGEAITRIGCFLNGCCFGTPSTLPWAMVFPTESNAGQLFAGVAIQPTQLYASLAHVAIFVVLLASGREARRPGYLFGLFLMLHASARLGVELLRYQGPSALDLSLGGFLLTPSRLVCLGLFLLGCYVLATTRGAVETNSSKRESGGASGAALPGKKRQARGNRASRSRRS